MIPRIMKWAIIVILFILACLAGWWIILNRIQKPILVPGTTTVIDPRTYIKTLENKLKGIDELKQKVDALKDQIQQQQGHTEQEISSALKETDIGKSVSQMKSNWRK